MSQLRPALFTLVLALLVAAPLTTVALATPQPTATDEIPADSASNADTSFIVRNQTNTTNYLDIRQERVDRGDYGENSLDVAGAIGTDVERLRGEYATSSFQAKYDNSTSDAERVALLRAEIDRLSGRIDALQRRQRLAVEDYNAGELSTQQFTRELATIGVAAREVDAQFQAVEDVAGLDMPTALNNRMDDLRADLVPFESPVRDRIVASMAGQQPGTTVYALTSSTGVVLATTDGEVYQREAYLSGNREQIGENNFVTDSDPTGISAANERARQLYPWTFDNNGPSIRGFGTTSVYRVTLDHPHGVLRTYLDGATREVFREIQTKQVGSLPTTTVENTTAPITLRVNRTHGTGPMEVTATDPTTGEPIDVTVKVNGYRVGSTGPDGTLWTITPHRSVRIQVIDGNETARVSFFAD